MKWLEIASAWWVWERIAAILLMLFFLMALATINIFDWIKRRKP